MKKAAINPASVDPQEDIARILGNETGYDLLVKTYDALYYSAIMKRKALMSQRKIKIDQQLQHNR